MSIKTVEMEITPAQAAEWLLHHIERMEAGKFKQRSFRPGVINKYASDMKQGSWVLCPQPIVFDENEDLLDGQHRLAAVKQANVPVRMMVSTGWPKGVVNDSFKLSTIDAIDRGWARTIANQLQLHGVGNATFVAAAANCFVRCCYNGDNMPMSYASTCYVLRELDVQRHLDILCSLGTGAYKFGRLLGPICFYRTSHAKKADEFFRQYAALDFNKNTGPWLLARYTTQVQKESMHAQKTFIRAVATCLKIWHEDRTASFIRTEGFGAMEWLAGTNPKLVDNIHTMLGRRGAK